ncbi:DUF4157 domain-containing protein [Streptomyces sp. NPDC018347]|uniref:DUF4157 domain-containing protein n=1 Tax=Streptomyces sp. NPDC018347 TaxID=3157193 RepID=UPI0033DF32A8
MRTSRSRAGQAGNEEPALRTAVGRKAPSGGAAVPPPLTADVLRAAQGGAGNAMVTGMIARRVRPTPVAHEHEEHEHEHDAAGKRQAADEVGSVVRSAGGRLPSSLQREMESRFEGEDFSDVVVHTGTAARRSADAVGAEAYTTGTNHIVFRDAISKKTLAHELEHVRQQRAGAVAGTDDGGGLKISNPSDPYERSAERKADQVMRGGAPEVRRRPGEQTENRAGRGEAGIQRMPSKKGGKKKQEEQPAKETAAPAKTEYEKIVEHFEGKSEEFAKKQPNEKEDILGALGIAPGEDTFTLAEVEADEELEEMFLEAVETTKHASGYSGTAGGKSDWAASAVTAAHKDLRRDYPFWGDKTTLHHKISRTELDTILASAKEAGASAAPLSGFLDEIRDVLGSTAADKKALHNMPANLEMGPASDTRLNDPGSGTDFNHTPSGALTPRSSELNDALSLAKRQPVDWAAVAEKLREAQRIHAATYGGAILSPPELARWEQYRGKWKKAGES